MCSLGTVAEFFPEKPSWCWNEQACQGVKCKVFELPYKNIYLYLMLDLFKLFSVPLHKILPGYRELFKCIIIIKKGMFLYSAVSSQLDRSKRFTLFSLPGIPGHSDTNSASTGSIYAQRLNTHISTKVLSIARYSFIQLSQLGHQWRERRCPILKMVAKGIRTRLTRLRVRNSTAELLRSGRMPD